MFKNQGLNSLMTIFLVFIFAIGYKRLQLTMLVIRQPIENEPLPKHAKVAITTTNIQTMRRPCMKQLF